MSYETNPILNRIKITKGWKNPNFPTKTLDYSREIRLWFKVYLFLKVYLWYQKIKLLSCEFRTSEKHTQIFYLSINKYIPSKKKKKNKSKWKKKSFLQELNSPLTKTKNKKARFLLYRDLNKLKKKSEFILNTYRKKIFSKAWLSKVRNNSWINFTESLFFKRKNYVKRQQHTLKKKIFQQKKQKKNLVLQFFLWKKIQRNIFHLLVKFQKRVFFLKKNLSFVWNQNLKNPTKICQILLRNFRTEYKTHLKFLTCLQELYQISLQTEIEEKNIKNSNFFKPDLLEKTYLQKTNSQTRNFLFLFKKSALFQKQQKFFLNKNKKFLEKKLVPNNFEQTNTCCVAQKNWSPWNLHLAKQFEKRFKRPTKIRKIHAFKLLRFAQKEEFELDFYEDLTKESLAPLENEEDEEEDLADNENIKNFSYRLSFKYNYRNHLTIVTNIKLKYLIENLIQQYFSIFGYVKLFWPLRQFKNLKFYRLFFPAYKQKHKRPDLKTKIFPLYLNKNLRLKNKLYLSLRQTTNHLKYNIKSSQAAKTRLTYNQVYKKENSPKFIKKPVPFSLHTSNIQSLSMNWPHFEQKKWEKKNTYLRLKKKVILSQSEKRLNFSSKQPFISNLITTVVHFSKYLDPQPLADHFAKLIGETKKHAHILRFMKDILRTIHLKRGVGYRIALTGRINGKNKSRTFYVRKLKRSRSRQTFLKNVNFARAHARATIGAFSVRIWVYS